MYYTYCTYPPPKQYVVSPPVTPPAPHLPSFLPLLLGMQLAALLTWFRFVCRDILMYEDKPEFHDALQVASFSGLGYVISRKLSQARLQRRAIVPLRYADYTSFAYIS